MDILKEKNYVLHYQILEETLEKGMVFLFEKNISRLKMKCFDFDLYF